MFLETYPTPVVIHDFSATDSRTRPRARGERSSLPHERAEFAGLLSVLGVEYRAGRSGWQTVRCWNRAAHTHGDRTPSMSVNLDESCFRCHGCGMTGGLTKVRKHARRERGQANRGPRNVLGEIGHLVALCEYGTPILSLVPPAALEGLRAETGRYKQDGALEENLRRLVAAVVARMVEVGHTDSVRFSATDATRFGIACGTWQNLLPLLDHVGVTVEVGESGRLIGRRVTQDEKRRLRATTVTARRCEYSVKVKTGGSLIPTEREYSHSENAWTTVLQAGWAVRSRVDTDGPRLAFRPAVSRLVTFLATAEGVIPASGGARGPLSSATFGEMWGRFGVESTERAVRLAEKDGLVVVVRIPADENGPASGFVTLTECGREVFERDTRAGRDRCREQALEQATRWADAVKRWLEMNRPTDRTDKPWSDEAAPWKPYGAGRVIHVETGEVRRLRDLAMGPEM